MAVRVEAMYLMRMQRLRTKFYAGEVSRENAFAGVAAIYGEMTALKDGQPQELRALKAAAFTLAFMEPEV